MILGLDLSLVGTGCIVLDKDGIVLSQLITSKPSGKDILKELKRLLGITKDIEKIIQKYKIKMVCIEGISYMSRNTGALTQLSGLNYFVRQLLYNNGIEFKIIPPTVLKKYITGKGNSAKELMLLETYKRFGVSFSDNNLCDAYGLAKIAYSCVYDDKKLTAFQIEIIKKIKTNYE